MPFDAITALREAGQPVDLLTDGQRQVLSALTEHEVEVLVTVQRRLRAAQPEVEGQELKLL
jgi:hypothetical protein